MKQANDPAVVWKFVNTITTLYFKRSNYSKVINFLSLRRRALLLLFNTHSLDQASGIAHGDPLNKLHDKTVVLENQILNILTQKAWRANVNSRT